MQSVRCYGETKFFRQCPRYILTDSTDPCFCWEHKEQKVVRLEEVLIQREEGADLSWAPIGAFITNREIPKLKSPKLTAHRLKEFADDDQNVHTAEVQVGVSGSIRRLNSWAMLMRIKTHRDLPSEIAHSLEDINETEQKALQHLQHCYQWNDDTRMFGITYPQLASWVWARVNREHENRELLRERFFQEVSESSGQCLNGNMARLINVFAAIDLEMSPQNIGMSREQLQELVSKAVQQATSCSVAIIEVKDLLDMANIPQEEHSAWLDSVREAF